MPYIVIFDVFVSNNSTVPSAIVCIFGFSKTDFSKIDFSKIDFMTFQKLTFQKLSFQQNKHT